MTATETIAEKYGLPLVVVKYLYEKFSKECDTVGEIEGKIANWYLGQPIEIKNRVMGLTQAEKDVIKQLPLPSLFPMFFNKLSEECNANSREHGFWDVPAENLIVASKIALIHSELSEALEEDRLGHVDTLGIELADAIIRICDLAGELGIDLDTIIQKKMEFNKTRPKTHGKRY